MLLDRESRPATATVGALPGTRTFADVARHPEAVVDPRMLIFRLDSPLIYINAGWMRDRLRDRLRDAQPPPQIVVLDLQMSSDLDIRGLDTLRKIADDLSDQGIELRLANVHGQIHEMLHRGALATTIGIQLDLNDAVRSGAEIGQERG